MNEEGVKMRDSMEREQSRKKGGGLIETGEGEIIEGEERGELS